MLEMADSTVTPKIKQIQLEKKFENQDTCTCDSPNLLIILRFIIICPFFQ